MAWKSNQPRFAFEKKKQVTVGLHEVAPQDPAQSGEPRGLPGCLVRSDGEPRIYVTPERLLCRTKRESEIVTAD